ncbi:MAG: DUF962 domain-containing protein [Candidatus Omnitrophica bacterium]|nr:DUF962 domain-containing protein [Candidatus Omnitrophota bacterium]
MDKIKWFINDFFSRHANIFDRFLHLIGISQVFFGLFQLITGCWQYGILNLFLGYLWQWIGHTYIEKNEMGEVLLIKKIIERFKSK